MLFEMLLPLKIKFLGLWIGVKWFNVFVLLRLTNRCHVGKELFKDYPTLLLETQLDESGDVMVGSRQTLILTWEAE